MSNLAIVPQILIDSEFKDLLPKLTKQEYQYLEKNILSQAIKPTVVVWQSQSILIDGHYTKQICELNNISYEIIYRNFSSRDRAIEWRINIHLGRRNLSAQAASYFRGKYYVSLKKNRGGTHKSIGTSVNTAKTIATQYGLSERTIRNDARFYQAIEHIAAAVEVTPNEIIALKISKEKIAKMMKQQDFQLVERKLNKCQGHFDNNLPVIEKGQVVRINSDRTDARLIGYNHIDFIVLEVYKHTADLATWGDVTFTQVHKQFLEPVDNARITVNIPPQLLALLLNKYRSLDEAILQEIKLTKSKQAPPFQGGVPSTESDAEV